MVNPTGYTALDLVGYTDRGTYAATTNYVKNDLVHHNGIIWRCLIDDTIGITPVEGVNWTVFINAGSAAAEEIIAPIETSPAGAAHTSGTQLIYNDTLYDVIANISIGDSLTVGTNIQAAPKISSQIQTLEDETSDIVNVLGAKNVAPITATTQVVSGVTFDVSDDGIVASGTATADISFLASYHLAVPKSGKYILSKAPSGAYLNSASDYNYVFYLYDSTSSSAIAYVASTETEVTLDATHLYNVFINIKSGITISKTFKLMIRPSSIVDDTYVPYAMTNRELTENVQSLIDLTEEASRTLTLTPDTTYCSDVIMRVRKHGKLVSFDLNIALNATSAALNYIPIVSGIPTEYQPIINQYLFGNILTNTQGITTNQFLLQLLARSTSNSDKIYLKTTAAVETGRRLILTGTYDI